MTSGKEIKEEFPGGHAKINEFSRPLKFHIHMKSTGGYDYFLYETSTFRMRDAGYWILDS